MTDSAAPYLSIDRENHPAVLAGIRSRTAAMAKDKQAWLANFAPEAKVEDPVGPSMFDPEGIGWTGAERIEQFWETAIAPTSSISFAIEEEIITGNEVLYICVITSNVAGYTTDSRAVCIYKTNDDGLLTSLKAYWEVAETMKTLRKSEV